MEHRIARPDQRPKLPTSPHPVRLAIAIHEHGGAEPLPVEPPANRYPVEFEILIVGALIGSDPPLLDPRIPAKIRFLSLQKPMCQGFAGTAPELQFKPSDRRFHHAIRRDRKSTRLNSSH